jgi:drug/metabolite transporter (DMT)-like permease
LFVMVAGSGAPFFVLVANGMRFAPAAEVGPLLPGTMPLFVAVMAYMLDGERPSLLRRIGFALIAIGIAAIVGFEMFSGTAFAGPGHMLVLTGALFWAAYTIAFRRSGLTAFEGAAIIAAWSTIMMLPFGTLPLIEALQAGRGGEIATQALVQGALSGIVAVVLFGVSILRLGASRAAAFAALIPALAALLAIPALGEIPAGAAIIGIVATSVGVALASGAFERTPPPHG